MHDKLVYGNSTLCHICNEELGKDKVRDHCHLSLPVVFHNLFGYDSHLFIKTFGNSEGDISCIPNNEENYMSFTKQVIVDKFINKEGKKVE